MGIAGSIVNPDFFQDTLGMRTEYVDMTEFVRRMEEGIIDTEEFKLALAWTRKHCREGRDVNAAPRAQSAKDRIWERVVQMTLIARDLMVGNPRLETLGFGEEALGHDAAILGEFQGGATGAGSFPQRRFHGGDPQLIVRLDR